jgi:hypothetical protein
LSAFQRSEVLAYFVKIEERDLEKTRPQLTNALHVVKLLFVDFLIRRKEYKVKHLHPCGMNYLLRHACKPVADAPSPTSRALFVR